MGRFSGHERELLAGIKDQLATIRVGDAPIIQSVLAPMMELLGLEQGLIYSARQEQTLSLGIFATAGRLCSSSTLAREADAMIRRVRPYMGMFNPARPAKVQQNRSMTFLPIRQEIAAFHDRGKFDRYGVERDEAQTMLAGLEQNAANFANAGLDGDWQVRVLVCEGASLLAWVGGFREEPLTVREERLLNVLTPALQKRLELERLLERGPQLEQALVAAMEGIAGSAFIVAGSGLVLEANSAGRTELDKQPSQTRAAIAEAVATQGKRGPFKATPVTAPDRATLFLLIARKSDRFEARLAEAVKRWELTRGQTAVLALVLRGKANKTIAAELQCSERTVEFHLTAILAKAEAESRADLIARFFLGE